MLPNKPDDLIEPNAKHGDSERAQGKSAPIRSALQPKADQQGRNDVDQIVACDLGAFHKPRGGTGRPVDGQEKLIVERFEIVQNGFQERVTTGPITLDQLINQIPFGTLIRVCLGVNEV